MDWNIFLKSYLKGLRYSALIPNNVIIINRY